MLQYSLRKSVAPTVEPLTVADFRKHAKIDTDETEITFTDLASTLASGWLVVTSAAGGFTNTSDEELVITSGTNFNPGRYSISSVSSDNQVTIASACGDTANASSGVGYVPTEISDVTNIVLASREHIERICRRSFITQTWQMRMRDWQANRIEIPMPPLQSVSSVTYTDTNGDSQSLTENTDFVVDIYGDGVKGSIEPAWGESWPAVRDIPNAIVITFVAGYGDAASDVPSDLVRAIKLVAGTMYDTRKSAAILPSRAEVGELGGDITVRRLLGPFMVRDLG